MLLNGVAVAEDDANDYNNIKQQSILLSINYHNISVRILYTIRSWLSLVSTLSVSQPIIFSSLKFSKYDFVFVIPKSLSHPKLRHGYYSRKHFNNIYSTYRYTAKRLKTTRVHSRSGTRWERTLDEWSRLNYNIIIIYSRLY